jgi:hypothetical protein
MGEHDDGTALTREWQDTMLHHSRTEEAYVPWPILKTKLELWKDQVPTLKRTHRRHAHPSVLCILRVIVWKHTEVDDVSPSEPGSVWRWAETVTDNLLHVGADGSAVAGGASKVSVACAIKPHHTHTLYSSGSTMPKSKLMPSMTGAMFLYNFSMSWVDSQLPPLVSEVSMRYGWP